MTGVTGSEYVRVFGKPTLCTVAVDEWTTMMRACFGVRLLQWLTHACGALRSLERCTVPSTLFNGCGMTGSRVARSRDGCGMTGMTGMTGSEYVRVFGKPTLCTVAVDEWTTMMRACLGVRLLQWLTHACGALRSLERCTVPSTLCNGCGMTGSRVARSRDGCGMTGMTGMTGSGMYVSLESRRFAQWL